MNKETKELFCATEKFIMQVESSFCTTSSFSSSYYNAQLLGYYDKLPHEESIPKYEPFSGTHCLKCGIKHNSQTMKLKVKSKLKGSKNANRTLIVHCTNCKTRTIKKSSFKFQKTTTATSASPNVIGSVLSPKTFPEEVSKSISTPAKLTPIQSLQNRFKLNNTPPSSPFSQSLTLSESSAGSAKSKKRKNRGKSFSPLQNMDKPNKTSSKPSLLSFLTSL